MRPALLPPSLPHTHTLTRTLTLTFTLVLLTAQALLTSADASGSGGVLRGSPLAVSSASSNSSDVRGPPSEQSAANAVLLLFAVLAGALAVAGQRLVRTAPYCHCHFHCHFDQSQSQSSASVAAEQALRQPSACFYMGQSRLRAEGATQTIASRKKALLTYLGQLVPPVFRDTARDVKGAELFPSYTDVEWRGVALELSCHFRYAALLFFPASAGTGSRLHSNLKGIRAPRARALVQLLSSQIIVLCFTVVMYNHQYPADDGSCASYRSAEDCAAHTRWYGVSDHSRCGWDEDVSNCFFRSQDFTVEVFMIVLMLATLINATLNLLLDLVFRDVLGAPSPEEYMQSVTVGISKTNLGLVGSELGSVDIDTPPDLVRVPKLCLWTERIRPVSAMLLSARELAIQAVDASFRSSVHQLKQQQQNSSDDADEFDNIHSLERISKTEARFDRFAKNFELQLRAAEVGPTLRSHLASIWGWSEEQSKFRQYTFSRRYCLKLFPLPDYCELLKTLLDNVDRAYSEEHLRLKGSPEAELGVELLNLFILDLLGPPSAAAQVYRSKVGQDFRMQMLVSSHVKRKLVVAIGVVNVVFIITAIMLSVKQTNMWQRQCAIMCVVQMFFIVCIFDVIECITTQFLIPKLFAGDISTGLQRLVQTSENALSLATYYSTSRKHGYSNDTKTMVPLFNSPDFFFLSRRLADKFENLFESFLVMCFFSQESPVEIAQVNLSASRNYTIDLSNFTLVSLMEYLLMNLGVCSFFIQQVVINVGQPVILYTIYAFMVLTARNPLLIMIPVFILSYELLMKLLNHRRNNTIHPVPKCFVPPVSSKTSAVPVSLSGLCGATSLPFQESDDNEIKVESISQEDASLLEVRAAEKISEVIEVEPPELHVLKEVEQPEQEDMQTNMIVTEVEPDPLVLEAATFDGIVAAKRLVGKLKKVQERQTGEDTEDGMHSSADDELWQEVEQRLQSRQVATKVGLVRALHATEGVEPWLIAREEENRLRDQREELRRADESKAKTEAQLARILALADQALQPTSSPKADVEGMLSRGPSSFSQNLMSYGPSSNSMLSISRQPSRTDMTQALLEKEIRDCQRTTSFVFEEHAHEVEELAGQLVLRGNEDIVTSRLRAHLALLRAANRVVNE